MANYISDSAIERANRGVLRTLREQETVKVIVLPDGGDPNLVIKISGTRWVIPKGREVEVPYDVYRYIALKYQSQLATAELQKGLAMKDMTPSRSGRRKPAAPSED